MTWAIAVVSFDHPHVTANLDAIDDHPDAELVGVYDEHPEESLEDMHEVADAYDIPPSQQFGNLVTCLRETTPDLVVVCADHVSHGDLTERIAEHGAHVLVEKPIAFDCDEGARMRDACDAADVRLAVNWPYTWSPAIRTMKGVVEAGRIGEVQEVHFYGGHSGPSRDSWFFDDERGGGSLLDFLGYGATLATWFRGGEQPTSVSTRTHVPDELSVDTQSVTTATYPTGLSTFETTYQAFSDPWERTTRPPNGFTIVGTAGTVTNQTDDGGVQIQTDERRDAREIDVEPVASPNRNAVEYVLHHLDAGTPFDGPTAPELSMAGQRIIDAARQSSEVDEPVSLCDSG